MSLFSENMRRLRYERHMTQEEFAELLGSTKQNISRYESGAVSPKISTAKSIADKLGITLAELSGEMDALRAELIIEAEDRIKRIRKDDNASVSEISDIDLALYGEIREMSEAKKREALDLFRFLRLQDEKQKQEAKS